MVEQEGPITVLVDRAELVGDQHHGPAFALVAVEDVEALLLERGVSHRQHLVHHQDLGVGLDGEREGEPHLHPRGEILELVIDELLQLGEADDLVEETVQLAPAQSQDGAAQEDVLPGGQLGVEADTQLEKGRDLALDGHPPRIGPVDPRQDLEQGALARAVVADDSDELTRRNLEADVQQGLQDPVARRAPPVGEPVLEG